MRDCSVHWGIDRGGEINLRIFRGVANTGEFVCVQNLLKIKQVNLNTFVSALLHLRE